MVDRLLKRVRDFAQVRYDGMITYEVAQTALNLLEVDSMGLDATDRNLLEAMITKFMGKPVGLETLQQAIGEDWEPSKMCMSRFLFREASLSEHREAGL